MQELPDCLYERKQPSLITPSSPTPNHSLYLSNLDDHHFLRFSIKYLYLFQNSISYLTLKDSLSRVLVDYYPFAGRIRVSGSKLEVDCNGEGAVFAEAFMDITCQEFLHQHSPKPNKSWRKFLFKVQAQSFLDIPPLVIQVTYLRCGGMILCTAINHCLCDGIGTSQFLHAWAHVTTSQAHLPTRPFHSRHVLDPRNPPRVTHSHPGFTTVDDKSSTFDIGKYLQSQPLAPATLTFTTSHLIRLKKTCAPSLKCTTFEVLAAHTWRSWAQSLELPLTMLVKLLFSVNMRKKLNPELPQGYYGNGFLLACAESKVRDLVNGNIYHAVKSIQEAKARITDEYVRSTIDLLEDKTVKTDVSCSLVISQWAKLGLEELDMGGGKPMYMGPLTSDIYCLFLPVAGNIDAIRVQMSLPEDVVKRLEYYMVKFFDTKDNEDENSRAC